MNASASAFGFQAGTAPAYCRAVCPSSSSFCACRKRIRRPEHRLNSAAAPTPVRMDAIPQRASRGGITAAAAIAAAAARALAPVKSRPVPGLSNWRYAGPPIDPDNPLPLPAVVYFALTAEQALELQPFNEFVRFLLANGDADASLASSGTVDDETAPLRVFSVTLPFHGTMAENEVALVEWAKVYEDLGDVVSFFTRKVSSSLDGLIADGHVDASRVYAAGLSRGGLLAGHLAVVNEHVNTVLGFSPVTELRELAEFAEVRKDLPKLKAASLLSERCVNALYPLTIRAYSGNADTRVRTRNSFDWISSLAERATANKVRSPRHEYIMYCSLGRDGHGTSSDIFLVGSRWLLRRAGLRA
jgi:hypothetical protein